MSYSYFDSLDSESRSRYQKLLTASKLKECPYRLPADAWVDNPTKWPDIEYPDIYDYLINTPGVYTRESMKNRKSLESHNQFLSGWVGDIKIYQNDGVSVLKANVLHSQALNKDPLHPWIAPSNANGSVICAHCDCMAGLGESCSHIGALLFKIEAANRLGYTKMAFTDLPCAWNNDFVKKIVGKEIKNINFYKKTKVPKQSLRRTFKPPTEDEKTSFLDKLQTLNNTRQPVVLSLFSQHSSMFHHQAATPVKPKIPKCLREMFRSDISEQDIEVQVEELIQLRLPKCDIDFIEKSTRKQNECLAWQEIRIGRITASVVYDVLHTDPLCPSVSLILKICTPGRHFDTPALKWGRDHEATALLKFIEKLKLEHQELEINKCGLLLDSDYPFLGASPDAVGECHCHGKFLVEIKCPFSHRDRQSIEECVENDKNFCLDENFVLKEKHQYMAQVQMQMYINKINTCHFVVWTPQFIASTSVQFNENFGEECVPKLVSFHKKHIALELIKRSYEKNKSTTKRSTTEKLCYCQQPNNENEEMVGCDNPDCIYKWIHYKCAKIKNAPKGTWYCKFCRRKRRKVDTDK